MDEVTEDPAEGWILGSETTQSDPVPGPTAAGGTEASRLPSRRPGRAVRLLAVAAVLALAGGGVAYAATGSSGPTYRTAAASTADVEQTLAATGTVQPVSSASLSFPVAGRVAGVSVTVGQHVTAGQPLAALDATSLQQALANAQAGLASAQAKLSADLAAQAAGVPSTSGSAGGSGAAAGAAASGGNGATGTPSVTTAAAVIHLVAVTLPGPSGASAGVKADQQQLVADQHQADLALAAASAALASARSDCAPVVGGTTGAHTAAYVTPTPSSSASSSTTNPGASSSQPSGGSTSSSSTPAPGRGSSSGATVTECSDALAAVLADQSTAAADLKQVASDASALDAAVSALAANSGGPTQGTTPGRTRAGSAGPATGAAPSGGNRAAVPRAGSSAGSGKAGSAGAGAAKAGSAKSGTASSSGKSGAGGGLVTAAQIESDQAAVDTASARVQSATLSVDQARLVSPIDGTVAEVGVTVGSAVGASSTTPAVVVIGPGSNQAVFPVPSTSIAQIHVGQRASVLPDGAPQPVGGTVVAVGMLPTSTTSGTSGAAASSGSVSYPVTVTIDGSGPPLFDGAGATVSVVLADAGNVLTVPTSAVRTLGSNHLVSVLRNGKATVVPVTIGATGPDRTQIVDGLSAGEQVVLANMATPLPTSGTTSIRGLTGGGGGAGGRTGGGFGGGGTTRG